MAKKPPPASHVLHDSCCNCRFWARLDDSKQIPAEDVLGECRRYPPAICGLDEGTEIPLQALPEVEARHWCGEHLRTLT